MSAGKLLREAVAAHKPLQIVGAINAYSAIMAEKTGIIYYCFVYLLIYLYIFKYLLYILFIFYHRFQSIVLVW
jgi:hypothetical protein